MIIAVDLDGTLSHEKEDNWFEYESCLPNEEHIRILNNELYPNHTIIIYTARAQEDEEVTKKWLEQHGVKYHELIFGKMRADLYLDENSGTFKDIKNGVYGEGY
jgi:hydroxymethylpyrimidine pyrophosphatase-like HAD family hydrolase